MIDINEILKDPLNFLKDDKKIELLNSFVGLGALEVESELLKKNKIERPEGCIFVGVIFEAGRGKDKQKTLFIRFGYVNRDFQPVKWVQAVEILPFLRDKIVLFAEKNRTLVNSFTERAEDFVQSANNLDNVIDTKEKR